MAATIHTSLEDLTFRRIGTLAPRLIAAARSGETVNLDLAGVTRVDTAGIQLLLFLRREAAENRTRLCFDNPSREVTALADFYGLDDLLKPQSHSTPAVS